MRQESAWGSKTTISRLSGKCVCIATRAEWALLRDEPKPSYMGMDDSAVFLSKRRLIPVNACILFWSSSVVRNDLSNSSAETPTMFSTLCRPRRVVLSGTTRLL